MYVIVFILAIKGYQSERLTMRNEVYMNVNPEQSNFSERTGILNKQFQLFFKTVIIKSRALQMVSAFAQGEMTRS